MTGRALATALVLCGLGAAACGGTTADLARDRVGVPPVAATAAHPVTGGTAATPAGSATGAASASAASPTPVGKPLSGKVVVIDPGHNGQNYRHPAEINKQVDVLTKRKACDTTGTATANGYSEAAFTWDVSQRLDKILKNRGAKVVLTRQDNTGVGPCITQRAAIGNKARANVAISIHADGAGPANHGFHVIIPKRIGGPVDPVVKASERLGFDVRDAMRSGTGLPYSTYIGKDALDYRNDIGGLNLSTVPKVLVECGNMKNPTEAARFQQPAFRQKIALSLANGLQQYLTH
ncbi:N-acetylmuramoyl-L-alanine amidase [Streptosporangium sp. NBC_01755]|uniref:N-acetylmuramoyl-L-alanine amidase n=1 Tax=Streptosporangium sp. NBC_01810 TaxID=2975951 RepID=UPI002DDAEC63|nr:MULTISPECIES: N-acetylmuramoyl-L-alanine amidase [unclassified Streptosporangium]WSA25704.1 N-acetylmuramoyl-L-alanine amidase [Streptosporangium sp. NBC_01810]WSD02906.1 N-acetylmuramoyl-L-alanine amidase [Streptosporangium sp. NBC_01755]